MSINIIGVTGPSGAGKSSLCDILKERNIPFINADELYHSLLVPESECTCALASAFGKEILDKNGAPDRRKLAPIVFSSEEALAKLNSIALEFVIKEMRRIIDELDKKGEKNVVIDAPTLIESGFHKECNYVITVLASKETRIERIAKRDAISLEAAAQRISAQKPDHFYTKVSDFVLENNRDEAEFKSYAEDMLFYVLKK